MRPDLGKRKYLGGHDVGPVLAFYRPGAPMLAALTKYATAADVFMRLVHGVSKPKTKAMARGLNVEPMLRELYRETVGPATDSPGVIVHPDNEWLAASPDGFISHDGVLELKSVSEFARGSWGEPGTDAVPDAYNVQLQWLFEVTGREWAHVLAAFGRDYTDEAGVGQFAVTETAVYQASSDRELRAALREAAERFVVEHILTGRPPDVEPRENKREWKRILSSTNGSIKEAAHGQ